MNAARSLPFVRCPQFDLQRTLDSGQVFHWIPLGSGFAGTIGEAPVYVEQKGDRLHFEGAEPECVSRYFALDHPLEEIVRTFPSDPQMQASLEYCHGMRIIRQPAWECLATFITSAMKQVAHIRQMSLLIRERWGKKQTVRGIEVCSYPPPESLALATEADLRECRLGFRARSLLESAQRVAENPDWFAAIDDLPDNEARQQLCTLRGVGEKIANCALLFGFERLAAVPIDVWIQRILREIYFKGRKIPARRLQTFSATYFGPYAGYAQQYLFHHARKEWHRTIAPALPHRKKAAPRRAP